MRLADRMNRLGTETACEVLARAKALEAQGKNIIHLQIGDPDFDTPKHISEAAKQALDDGFTHYGPSAGQADLREVIANHMKKCYIAWSKSSIDDQIILKHLEKLSKGKLQLHKDFIIIEDNKATARRIGNGKRKNNRHNNKKKRN